MEYSWYILGQTKDIPRTIKQWSDLMVSDQPLATSTLKRSEKQKSVYIQVVDQIQASIKTGQLVPGDQLLPERELAEQFGVSRPSVRQALAVLDNLGMVEITPRDGAYIRRPGLEKAVEPLTQALFWEREQVAHLFEMRLLIETQAGSLAALRRDEADLKRLREINQRFARELDHDDRAYQANREFHTAIVETAKNPLLTEVMTPILMATMEVYISARAQSLPKSRSLARFVVEHEQIIEALARQATAEVGRLIAAHIDDARSRVQVIIEGREEH
jgi:GntR family transcriptional repressor for pyruvate dehydrogenase complex